jgi:uncharacterized protein YwgA
MARTLRDRAIDHFLTLYLINDAFSRKNLILLPSTKLQKLVFLSEKNMIDKREKGFNFYFIKLIHGPFSQELENDVSKLVQDGYINDMGLKPTENTPAVLEDFNDIIERNRVFFRKVDAVNDDFAPMSLQKLLRIIYAMPWGRGKGRTIADLPQRTPMLYPMKPEIVETNFRITDNEAEDLLMNFDPDALKDLSEAMKDAREGKWRTYEQVFSDL